MSKKEKHKWMTVLILHSLRRKSTYLLTCGRRSLVSDTQNDIAVNWITLWGMIKVYWLDFNLHFGSWCLLRFFITGNPTITNYCITVMHCVHAVTDYGWTVYIVVVCYSQVSSGPQSQNCGWEAVTWWSRATLSGLTEPISLSTPLCGVLANPITRKTSSTAWISTPRSTRLTTYLAIPNCLTSARLICKGHVLVENNIAVADCWCLVTVCSRVGPFTCGYRSDLKDGERRFEILYMWQVAANYRTLYPSD